MKGDVNSTSTQKKDWKCTKMLTVVMGLYIIFVFFFILSIFSIIWKKKNDNQGEDKVLYSGK